MAPHIAHDALTMIEYRDLPSVLILADSEAGMERARRSAERAGCRVSAAVCPEGWIERLDLQAGMDAVIVELERDHGALLERTLDRLDGAAGKGRHGSVVSGPPELIDLIVARAGHPGVVHLCDPDEQQRAEAVGIAVERDPARLHDARRANGSDRLQQLSEEVGRIAGALAALSEETRSAGEGPAGEPAVRAPATQIRAIIRARRLRDQHFDAALFADPAWDMLLDLMAARLRGEKVAVSSLCIAAAVPPTTALRWIKSLCDQGLFVRAADPEDGRRVFIALSDEAAAAMEAYFAAALRLTPVPA